MYTSPHPSASLRAGSGRAHSCAPVNPVEPNKKEAPHDASFFDLLSGIFMWLYCIVSSRKGRECYQQEHQRQAHTGHQRINKHLARGIIAKPGRGPGGEPQRTPMSPIRTDNRKNTTKQVVVKHGSSFLVGLPIATASRYVENCMGETPHRQSDKSHVAGLWRIIPTRNLPKIYL